MKARISTEQKFSGFRDEEVEKTDYTDSSMTLRKYSINGDHYSEEARNYEAYRAYKLDLGDLCDPDYELEQDFFGQRELTISDFDGTNTIVTPNASPTLTPIKKRCSAATVTNHPAHRYPNTSTQANNPSRSPVQEKTYTSQRSPSILVNSNRSREAPLGSTNAWFLGHNYPTIEHTEQLLQSDNDCSSLTNTEVGLSSQHGACPSEPACTRCAEHMELVDAFVTVGTDKTCDVGKKSSIVGHHIRLEHNINEKARVPSQTAEIYDSPVPELDGSDDSDSDGGSPNTELGYDASPGTLHFFSQAGVHVTTRDLQDDFVSAQSTNLAGGYLDIDQNAEDEKARANIDFFKRSPSLETLSEFPALILTKSHGQSQYASPFGKKCLVSSDDQHLIPTVVDDLADPDYYLSPDAPTIDDTMIDTIYQRRYDSQRNTQGMIRNQAEPPMANYTGSSTQSSLLDRRANRDSDASMQSFPRLLPLTYSEQESKNCNSSLIDLTSSSQNTLSPRISKIPVYGESLLAKKRPARESFDLIALCDENARREFACKKPRVASYLSDTSIHMPQTPTSAVSSTFAYSPMATALQGYAGQFEMHLPETLSNVKVSTEQHVFGSHLHANGEVINTHFVADTSSAGCDLSDSPNLRSTIEHGYLHHCFAEEMPLTDEEERLRKEAHRECSAARLEGVPVGYYRYFAGHMTVEEYVDARLCVCWDRCFCSKLCTRFGDLACPCAEHLIVGDD